MNSDELRRKFLEYFEGRGHTIVDSYSLVPHDDPTLLFTNAGMVQFKDVFLGLDTRPYKRAVTSQKCVRAGGKHNDLDTVGRTARHHTFFEMLGNFSFGDYFKQDAIIFAWEFLTKILGLPKERLWVSIYKDDDEAGHLWLKLTGVEEDRIIRLGEKDNFWQMGDTGPCGPCSEILFDRGEEYRCRASVCAAGQCDCDRWLEIWNLVFMQYDRDKDGNLTPLPKPSIDTGMGLERIASIIQDVPSNFDTDLLRPIIAAVEETTGKDYDPGPAGFPFRVISDHIRACTFLINDGVLPSNDGRGYVLRRILRRAVRFGKALGLDEPFMHRLVAVVIDIMGGAYPELVENKERIEQNILLEEKKFHETLHEGLKVAVEMIARTKKSNLKQVPGSDAFTLYDTFGFPLDLMEDIAEEHGLGVEKQGFEDAMEEQRRRARAAREHERGPADFAVLASLLADFESTNFLGYHTLRAETELKAVVKDGSLAGQALAGEEVDIFLPETPFYAESGGQVGDVGILETETGIFEVRDTRKLPDGKVLHAGRVNEGTVSTGQKVLAVVEENHRLNVARSHTSTHLLHKALNEILGDDAAQKGSLVAPDRLRFDFSHPYPLSKEEMRAVESRVLEKVVSCLPVDPFITGYDEAKQAGAVALFGEKYSDEVRVVKIGDYSMELCGGTHVDNTSQICALKIISEGGIGSGLRRIEAVTGRRALDELRRRDEALKSTAEKLKTTPDKAAGRAEQLVNELKQRERELESLQARLAKYESQHLINDNAEDVKGIQLLAAEVKAGDAESLRSMADVIREKMGSGVILLAAEVGGKANFVVMASEDAIRRGAHAGKLISDVARIAGGGGGGRPEMAQAGGKKPEKIGEALSAAKTVLSEQVKD